MGFFGDFSLSLKTNAWMVLRSDHNCFLLNPSKLILHYSSSPSTSQTFSFLLRRWININSISKNEWAISPSKYRKLFWQISFAAPMCLDSSWNHHQGSLTWWIETHLVAKEICQNDMRVCLVTEKWPIHLSQSDLQQLSQRQCNQQVMSQLTHYK